MLFIHLYDFFGLFFPYSITIDSLNINNQSKASACNKVKHLLNKCPRFSKIGKVGEHLNQFLVLLCDCMPRLSQFLGVDKVLKNVSLLGMGENPTTPLFSDTTKHGFFYETKAMDMFKSTTMNVNIFSACHFVKPFKVAEGDVNFNPR